MEPVMMDAAELKAIRDDMKKAVEVNDGLKRELEAMRRERDQALQAANLAKIEAGRLSKALPSDRVLEENKGLRSAISETHKKVSALEKELASSRAEAEAHRKEAAKVLRRFEGVQSTFDTLQVARDKAQKDRDLAVAEQQKAVEAFQKLQGEFDAYKKATEAKAATAKGVKSAPVAPAVAAPTPA